MMQHKGYAAKVEFDAEAGILHGEVVGIRDVVTFQGRSIDEIEQAFRDSVDDYLSYCRKRGEDPDKPCSGKFVVRVGGDLHRRLDRLARLTGKSLNSVVAELLEKEVDAQLPAEPRPPRQRHWRAGQRTKAASGTRR